VAIVVVILLNAAFPFVQEQQAERALGGDEWAASIQAWHTAHPGDTMIGE
jgi:hypothetical protein